MSRENVEIVQRFVDALDRRDYPEAIGCLHDDAEWHNTAAFPGDLEIRGAVAIIAFWQTLSESFDEATGRTVIEHLEDRDELVVAGVRSSARGAGSGVPIDVTYALTISVRGQRIERIDVRGEYPGALEAAGLSE